MNSVTLFPFLDVRFQGMHAAVTLDLGLTLIPTRGSIRRAALQIAERNRLQIPELRTRIGSHCVMMPSDEQIGHYWMLGLISVAARLIPCMRSLGFFVGLLATCQKNRVKLEFDESTGGKRPTPRGYADFSQSWSPAMSGYELSFMIYHIPGVSPSRCVARDAEAFAHIFSKIVEVSGRSSQKNRVANAIRSFHESFFIQNQGMRLALLMATLENVMLPKGGAKRSTIANRVAGYLENDHVAQQALVEKLKKFYDMRSTAVHTGRGADEGTVLELEKIARCVLVKALKSEHIHIFEGHAEDLEKFLSSVSVNAS